MGRAARNVNGEVVLYADEVTDSMDRAIEETTRRREIQRAYNEEHGFEPTTIDKPIGETNLPGAETDTSSVAGVGPEDLEEAERHVEELQRRMAEAADNLEFELAADIRDRIRTIHEEFDVDASAGEGVAPEPDAEF
jgi:excinuclease ABC subunit B